IVGADVDRPIIGDRRRRPDGYRHVRIDGNAPGFLSCGGIDGVQHAVVIAEDEERIGRQRRGGDDRRGRDWRGFQERQDPSGGGVEGHHLAGFAHSEKPQVRRRRGRRRRDAADRRRRRRVRRRRRRRERRRRIPDRQRSDEDWITRYGILPELLS